MKDLVHSVPINTVEVLRGRMENAATTIRNNREMLQRVKKSFRLRLHYCIHNERFKGPRVPKKAQFTQKLVK
jgi:hypothetical protein